MDEKKAHDIQSSQMVHITGDKTPGWYKKNMFFGGTTRSDTVTSHTFRSEVHGAKSTLICGNSTW